MYITMIMIMIICLYSILSEKLKKRCVKRWALNIKGVLCFNGNAQAVRQDERRPGAHTCIT